MRLSVGEYMSTLGPRGERPVVAFFDLDRTLIDGYSLTALAREQLFAGQMGPRRLVQLGVMFLRYARKSIAYPQMLQSTVDSIRGMEETALRDLGKRAFEHRLVRWMYREGAELVAAHMRCGHEVVIVTSATRYQAEPVARALNVGRVFCTELEIIDGKVSGKVVACHGHAKLVAARNYLSTIDGCLADAYFYSDSHDDVPLLEMVGNPVVVNGRPAIAQVSDRRGWPFLEFDGTQVPKTAEREAK